LQRQSAQRGSAATRTFRNSVLFGCEMVLGIVSVLCTSIPLARIIGPERLGYFTYIQWLTMVGSTVAFLGIPATTRRYMAESLGRGDLPAARGIFFATLRLQAYLALGVFLIAEVLVFTLSDRSYWSSSWIIVLSVLPRMMLTIPSQAHLAGEHLECNFISFVASSAVLVGVMDIGLWYGGGLVVAAVAYVASNAVEMILKLIFAVRWLGWGPRVPLGAALRKRMITFSRHSAALLVLNLVVWDKSDFFFLELLRKDRASLAFFSTAFNLADRAVQIVQVFVNGLSVSLMSELGRSIDKMYTIAKTGLRYTVVIAGALLFGLAAVGPQAVLTLYGPRFAPAGAMLSIAAALAVGKCIMPLMQALFQAAERQQAVVVWSCCCGVLNVVLDLLLIPPLGALGAVIANGSAQVLAAVGLIYWAQRTLNIDWSLSASIPGLAAGVGSAAAAYVAGLAFTPAPVRLAVGILAGAVVFLPLLKMFGGVQPDDLVRLHDLTSRLPVPVRRTAESLLGYLA